MYIVDKLTIWVSTYMLLTMPNLMKLSKNVFKIQVTSKSNMAANMATNMAANIAPNISDLYTKIAIMTIKSNKSHFCGIYIHYFKLI